MYVAPGARAKLLEKRNEQFFEQYVVTMLREAEKLGIATEQVIEMIQRRVNSVMSTVVEVSHLTKSYGSVMAVNQVSFSIEAGKIYGLLGRNGAGKTTIMRLITAQLFPTSGEVKVFGASPYENSRVLSQICFIKDSQKYPEQLSRARRAGAGRIVLPQWDREYAFALVEEFRLPLSRKMKALSRGMLSAAGSHRRPCQPRAADHL